MSETTESIERRCRHCGATVSPTVGFCSKCGATTTDPSSEADPLAESLRALFRGELEIERELGRGGMAAVYAAFDPALQRRVAVKTILPDMLDDSEIIARFLREARAVAALQHPNVVSVYSVRSGQEASAIVMQFVEGRSLDVALAERSPLPLAVASLILSQVAAGLQHAHDRGLVHRDVKPANVLLDHDGHAVVSDFGIARREGVTRITGEGMVVGTLAYMSPEQRRGGEIGPASDQYSFGVMAFELLAGRLPFVGTLMEISHAHLHDPAPSLRQIRPELPVQIDALVARMLEKDPKKRFEDLRGAERLLSSLVPDVRATTLILAGITKPLPEKGSRIVRSVAPPAPPAAALTERSQPTPTSAATAKPARGSMWIAASLVLAAVLLGGWWAMRARQAPVETTSNTGAIASSSSAPVVSPIAPPTASAAAAPNSAGSAAAPVPPPPSTAPSTSAAPRSVAATPPAGSKTQPAATPVESAPVRAAEEKPAVTKPIESPPSSPAPAPAAFTATVADARAIAREFVTALNQHRWRDVEQLGTLSGDAALRAEIVRLARTAADFSAGFNRIASAPVATADGFVTDCALDLDSGGKQRAVELRLRAEHRADGWHVAAFGVEAVP